MLPHLIGSIFNKRVTEWVESVDLDLDSPRTLQAMLWQGVVREELIWIPKQEYYDKFCEKCKLEDGSLTKLDEERFWIRWENYIKNFQSTVKSVVGERNKLLT